MTIERAAEMVSMLRENQPTKDLAPCDLFEHFVDVFKLEGTRVIQFAQLCGFLIALNVEKLD